LFATPDRGGGSRAPDGTKKRPSAEIRREVAKKGKTPAHFYEALSEKRTKAHEKITERSSQS